jgi:hypothetical protein
MDEERLNCDLERRLYEVCEALGVAEHAMSKAERLVKTNNDVWRLHIDAELYGLFMKLKTLKIEDPKI